jgi:hypothetical protein
MKQMPYEGRSSITLAHLFPCPTLPLFVNSRFPFLAAGPCLRRSACHLLHTLGRLRATPPLCFPVCAALLPAATSALPARAVPLPLLPACHRTPISLVSSESLLSSVSNRLLTSIQSVSTLKLLPLSCSLCSPLCYFVNNAMHSPFFCLSPGSSTPSSMISPRSSPPRATLPETPGLSSSPSSSGTEKYRPA